MADGREAGARLMFGPCVRVLPGGSAMPRGMRGDAELEGLGQQRTRAAGFRRSLHMHGVRGWCLDGANKDSC